MKEHMKPSPVQHLDILTALSQSSKGFKWLILSILVPPGTSPGCARKCTNWTKRIRWCRNGNGTTTSSGAEPTTKNIWINVRRKANNPNPTIASIRTTFEILCIRKVFLGAGLFLPQPSMSYKATLLTLPPPLLQSQIKRHESDSLCHLSACPLIPKLQHLPNGYESHFPHLRYSLHLQLLKLPNKPGDRLRLRTSRPNPQHRLNLSAHCLQLSKGYPPPQETLSNLRRPVELPYRVAVRIVPLTLHPFVANQIGLRSSPPHPVQAA